MAHPMMVKAKCGVEKVIPSLLGNDRLADAAANRLYYAIYHACWAFLRTRVPAVPFDESPGYVGESTFYQHNKLADKLREFIGTVGAEGFQALDRARRLRRKADYEKESVERREVDVLAPRVKKVVSLLDDLCRQVRS